MKKLKVKLYKKKKCVVIEFPFKTIASIIIGIRRVYPELKDYMKKNKYKNVPIMELYDKPNEKILYIAPIKK